MTSVTWGLTVGSLGTWGVLQLMSAFPCCFTMGEATVVTHSFILFLMSAVTNLPLRYHLPPIHDSDISTVLLQVIKMQKLIITISLIFSLIHHMLQVVILYIVLVCFLCRYFPILCSTAYFYLTTISLLCFVIFPVLYIILDRNPILWTVSFAFSSHERVSNNIIFRYIIYTTFKIDES